MTSSRFESLDAARGIAIALMFLSHIINGLIPIKKLPDLAVVPIHAITKFSSTLFILVFGVAVALVYLQGTKTPRWPKMRLSLWKRALIVMVWYKLLTFVQMYQNYSWDEIYERLLFIEFPDYVEILQFYGWLLLLLPLVLPLWAKMSIGTKLITIYAMLFLAQVLRESFDFWGLWQLKAIIVETRGAYCFGVLTRGALALAAITLGEIFFLKHLENPVKTLAGVCLALGIALLASFLWQYYDDLENVLRALAHNAGKHPPNMRFMSFSLGGALIIFSLVLYLFPLVPQIFAPFVAVGKESLFCFNFHIIILFIVFRDLFDLRENVNYAQALSLTVALFALAVAISVIITGVKINLKQSRT